MSSLFQPPVKTDPTTHPALLANTESKSDFRETLVPSLLKHTELPLAVLEYRLSPDSQHPAHLDDVQAGLSLLSSADDALLPGEQGTPAWNRSRLVLLGHSVGAFMCLQLLLGPPPSGSKASALDPRIQSRIEAAFLIDGIYDLPSLLEEYPSYRSFVQEAFGEDAKGAYEVESPARWPVRSSVLSRTEMHVLHSRQDELLSLAQPHYLLHRLGLARTAALAAAAAAGGSESDLPPLRPLKVDFEALTGTHDEVVHAKSEALARYVAAAVRR